MGLRRYDGAHYSGNVIMIFSCRFDDLVLELKHFMPAVFWLAGQ